jgi:chorismate dehydratase
MNRSTAASPAAVRVGRISYMNVAPLYAGFDPPPGTGPIEWIAGPPSQLNRQLADGELDIAPISSFAYGCHQSDWLVLPDLSVASGAQVMSVLAVSRLPWAALDGRVVALTRDSAAAAGLLKLLLARDGIAPRYTTALVRAPADLTPPAAAGLVIGDAALRHDWSCRFPHVWDLGQRWRQHSGLPFVFALWAVRREFAQQRPEQVAGVMAGFQAAKANLAELLPAVYRQAAGRLLLSEACCRRYYRCLDYNLGPMERKGLNAYFTGLQAVGLIPRPVVVHYFDPGRPVVSATAAA